MKICFIIDSLVGAGAEKVVISLADGFSKLSYDTHIIIFENVVEHDIPDGISIYLLKERSSKELKALIKKIEEKDEKKFDYIYSHLHSNIKILKEAKLQNIYYLFHIPISKRFENGNFLSRFLKKKKLQLRYKGENLITVSKGIEEDILQNWFKPKSIETIYNPFDFEDILAKGDMSDNDIPKHDYIINVARFHPQKRHDILLKAFAKSKLDCKLVLLGQGSKKESSKIKKLIKTLGIEDRVLIKSFRQNPYPLIKNAKLFVLSSDFEGLPTVIIESLILNTPVVSTNCKSGPSEIMVGNLSKYLVPVGDVDKLADMIKKAFFENIYIDRSNLDRFRSKTILNQYLQLGRN